MLVPPWPENEAARQRALDALELVDTPADPYLQQVVAFVRHLFEVPVVLVSLVDCERQWFKARVGLDAAETPRDISFCGHAVAANELLVVEDTLLDSRFADNPLVVAEPHIRFYAGYPLRGDGGLAIGTLCMISSEPRPVSAREGQLLAEVGGLVEAYLRLDSSQSKARELRRAVSREQRKALLDPLTQVWNRAGFNQFINRLIFSARESSAAWGVLFCDLDQFKAINDQYGHAAGDRVLWAVARAMAETLRQQDLLCRYGGEEFVVAAAVADFEQLYLLAERLRGAVAKVACDWQGNRIAVTCSVGVAVASLGDSVAQVVERADAAMYRAKQGGRNRVEV